MADVADDSKNDSRSVIGSYVAVGDSFTEGVGDPGPDGAFVGWADRFAVLLADRRPEGDFGYTNLAVRGKLLDQIVEDQLPQAMELGPGPGLLLRGRQRHHPARHRPRRGRRALRAGRRRPHRGRRHRHGDDRLRHPWRARAQAPARQDRHVQRPCAGHRRPLRLPGARPVVPEDRPGPPGLGRRPAAPLRPRGTRAWRCAPGQVLGLEVPADPDQPWPPLPPRGTAGGPAGRHALGARVPGAVDRAAAAGRVLRGPRGGEGRAVAGRHQDARSAPVA